jgi:hypothetical protein
MFVFLNRVGMSDNDSVPIRALLARHLRRISMPFLRQGSKQQQTVQWIQNPIEKPRQLYASFDSPMRPTSMKVDTAAAGAHAGRQDTP